jgi:8-oxo-dGTP pyrophosphatase MutT (NUDIX family)
VTPGPLTVSAVLLLREDGAALLQHRDDKPGLAHADMWVPPGGHSEPGESAEACARREFLEETTYTCASLTWLAETDVVLDGFSPFHLTVFWARYDGVQETVCREGQELAFVRREDADAHRIPAFLIPIWDRALVACRESFNGEPVPVATSPGKPNPKVGDQD